ncbi:MAG: class I SAM-dependent methyltransferase [Thermodesulfobacteriota bacterium]|nr:class I SAM-dependent methyltransferase [Thermodesulfobacteriota bacterium]
MTFYETIRIHSGDFDNIDSDEDGFDIIFTVNTIYFWRDPERTISKIFALLKPGGKLLIGLHEKSEMENMPLDRDVFKYYAIQDLKALLCMQGPFDDMDIISRNGKERTCYCVVGTKSGQNIAR